MTRHDLGIIGPPKTLKSVFFCGQRGITKNDCNNGGGIILNPVSQLVLISNVPSGQIAPFISEKFKKKSNIIFGKPKCSMHFH